MRRSKRAARSFPQMAAQAPCRRRRPGGSRRPPPHLQPSTAEPVAQRAHRQRKRAAARGVQAKNQDADRVAFRRHRGHAVLGAACFRSDSTCPKSMDGRHAPQSPSINQLTSSPETIPSCYGRSRHAEFRPLAGHHLGWRCGGLETSRQRFGTRRFGSDIPIVTRRAS